LFGKIKPTLFVKILGMIFTDDILKTFLEWTDDFVIGLSGWRKIVWRINSLLFCASR
jgi:hypothetical protein